MKRLIFTVFLLILAFSTLFTVSAAATTDVQTDDSPVVATRLSNFWINSWNDIPESQRPITAYDKGLDESHVDYGNFSVYKEIQVVNPEAYYSNPAGAGFSLRRVTDLTPYKETGFIRFWISVPKDMSVRVSLKSFDGTKYSETAVTVALSAAEESDVYQEVEIPLASFFAANKNWDAVYTRYVLIGGIRGCDETTFLDIGEILRVSPIEIWGSTPPEPVVYDATPVYRDINGEVYIKDINGVLDETSVVKAFNNSLEKQDYKESVKGYGSTAELLSLYAVNVVSAGTDDYSKKPLSDYVEVYLHATKEMKQNYITVATLVDGEIVECDFSLTDKYLIINTNSIGAILIIDTNAPVFSADTMASSNEEKLVNDNALFDKAVFFKNSVGTGNAMIFNEYNTPLTDITDWLKNEDGVLRFYVKAPYRENAVNFKFKIGLCLRYYIYKEVDGVQNAQGQYPQTTTVITVPADGNWHEIRLSSTAFSSTAFDKILDNEEYAASYDAFYVRVAANSSEYSTNTAEGLYFTDFDFYKKALLSESFDGNTDKEYKEITTLTSNPSWKTDSKGHIIRNSGKTDELPFFTNTVSFTASDTYTAENAAAIASTQLGIAYRDGVLCKDFAEWAYYNRNASLRFWVKTERDITFKVGILANATGSNSEITATVTCPASDDWQEIKLKRSDFFYSSTFENIIVQNDIRNIYFNLYVLRDTFEAGKTVEFSRRVEIFNDKAYEKGDITLDGNVNAVDLVRTKKIIVNNSTEFINGDIDSDGKLTALDLSYIRNRIMSGKWK